MTRMVVILGFLGAAAAALGAAELRVAGFAGIAIAAAFAVVKVIRWRRRRAGRRTLAGLRALHPHQFEAEVAGWLRRDGWNVEHRGGTGDGGIDVLATRKAEVLAVQCKRYAESAAVSAAQVRDLFGAATAHGATAAVIVTTGRVSGPAVAWAEALPSGPRLRFHDSTCLARLASAASRV